jgi:hypothetical protein
MLSEAPDPRQLASDLYVPALSPTATSPLLFTAASSRPVVSLEDVLDPARKESIRRPGPVRGSSGCTVERSRRMVSGSHAGLCRFPRGTPGGTGSAWARVVSGPERMDEVSASNLSLQVMLSCTYASVVLGRDEERDQNVPDMLNGFPSALESSKD